MNHAKFKERLEEIQTNLYNWGYQDALEGNTDHAKDHCDEATQSLTQLFQDFKDAVIGEEEPFSLEEEIKNSEFDLGARKIESQNQLRQTQHQTANLILNSDSKDKQ